MDLQVDSSKTQPEHASAPPGSFVSDPPGDASPGSRWDFVKTIGKAIRRKTNIQPGVRYDDELTRKIGAATASEDWTLVLDVCDHASSSKTAAKAAVTAIRREFTFGEPAAQLAAARLWAIMLRNSSDVFITECTSKKFLDTIEDLATSSRISPVVRERVLDVLAAAAFTSDESKDSGFRGLWRRVKPKEKPDEGVPFDTEDAMFNPPLSGGRGRHLTIDVPPVVTYQDATPIVTETPPPPAPPTSEGDMPGDNRRTPRQRDRRSRVRIIPPDEDIRRLFQECVIGSGNARLLSEALAMATPDDLTTDPVIVEFHWKCVDSQALIITQIPWASAGAERSFAKAEQEREQARLNGNEDPTMPATTREEDLLGELLAANELIQETLKQYDDLKRVGEERQVEDNSRKETKLDERTLRQSTTEDGMLTADPALGLGGKSPSPSRPPSPVPHIFSSPDPSEHSQTLARPSSAPNGPHSPSSEASPTCDLRAQLLPSIRYTEEANSCGEAYTQLYHWQQIFEAQTKEQIAACPDMDDELMHSPSESAAINVYEQLMLFLSHSTQDNRLRVALGSVATFTESLDPVWSFVQSAQLRIQLFRISSILNITDGEQLRAAVAKDESALGMLLHQIMGTERQKKRLLRLKEENAQCAIDLIQDILDKNLLYDVAPAAIDSETLITQARRLLVRLSEVADRLPASLFIHGILQVDKEASFGGAFGDIYRASYKGQHVALKRMRVHVFQRNSDWHKLRRRLYREALLWQRLQNPFVLPFTGIDTESFPSFLCLVSPWMKHGTILKHLAENGNANVEQKLLEIAKGLLYLHSQDVVHGDLRGSNILVDDNWQVRLADFGLAGFSDATVGTQTSHRGGSVRWMSPELHWPQSCGLDSFRRTFASDAYSFACVCLELSQGKPPFFEIKEDMAVVLRVLAKERPARPEDHVSDSMWGIMQQCWAHDPAQRPSMAWVVEMMQETMNI